MRAPISQVSSQDDLAAGTSHPIMSGLDQQALRQMMNQAAAVASAATAKVSEESTQYIQEVVSRPRVSGVRISTGRRHSNINQLPAKIQSDDPLDLSARGGPLPPVEDGVRWQRIQQVADELKKSYEHPDAAQIETETLHHVRAILFMNRTLITQSFVSHVTGVSQGSLSHYVRGLFRGKQGNVDERLARFVEQFATGELDQYIEEIRLGIRPAALPLYFPTTAPAVATPSQPPQLGPERPALTERTPVAPPAPPQLHPAPWTQSVSRLRPSQSSSDPLHSTSLNPTASDDASGQASSTHDQTLPTESLDASAERPAQGGEDTSDSRISLPSTTHPVVLNEESVDESADIPGLVQSQRQERLQQKVGAEQSQRQESLQQKVGAEQPQLAFPDVLRDSTKLTPEVAMERAFHTLMAADWSPDVILAEPLLIPIELSVNLDGFIMHMYTQWDVNEHDLSPEVAADRLRRARGLPETFKRPIAAQIRRALFDAGVPCAPPPAKGPVENRRIIRFTIHLTTDTDNSEERIVSDEVEWDLANETLNSPELFAHQFCVDEGIHQRHATKIAQAIRKKITLAQAISYGDESTQKAALDMLENGDPLRFPLGTVRSALIKCIPEDHHALERRRNEKLVLKSFVSPLINAVNDEALRRTELRNRKAAEDSARKAYEDFKRHEDEREQTCKRQEEEERRKANEEALRVYKDRNLDFRPYLALVVARGEHPSLWMPPAFDRRKRKQLTFPMIQQCRRASTSRTSKLPRHLKLRRSLRDSLDAVEERGDFDAYCNRGSEENHSMADDAEKEDNSNKNDQTSATPLPLKLRIRKPVDNSEHHVVRTRKRRRR